MADKFDIHNPETFTWWAHNPKTTSCGILVSDYPNGVVDTLDEDARGDEVRAKLVTCRECRAMMKRGWFLRWLFN